MPKKKITSFRELTNAQIDLGLPSDAPFQITENFRALVVKVTDGDTVRLRMDKRDFDFPMRLVKIDAPEMNEGGKEAKEYLRDFIEGEEVDIIIDKDNRVDKYGRLLGDIFYMGFLISEDMMRTGRAVKFGEDDFKLQSMDKIFNLGEWFK
jgi:endonuclease YncB( thermonuclease family)